MSLSVKVYLNPDTEEQEIRRFSVDEGASASFTYLQQKIESVFPSVRGKRTRLFWKDEDGELITFSSGEELVEALGSISGDVFRIYVKVVGDTASDASFQDGEHTSTGSGGVTHTNVVCDGCEVVITGTRFKCAVCPDYDLCAKCERKGNHNHHEMLRICFPRQHPWFGENLPFGPPPFGPHRPHHHSGFGPWGRGGCQWFGRGRGGPWGGRGRCGGPRDRCGSGARCSRHQEKADKKNEESAEVQAEVPVGPPFLHNMGEVLASFLSPLGVEVHTYADNEPVCCQGKCPDKDRSDSAAAAAGPEDTEASPQSPLDEGASTSAGKPMDTSPEPEGYVVVDKDKENSQNAATAEAAQGTSADETPVDPLEIAIAQMRAMGFEDDNGWLAQLLKSKDYDISKVLDAIHFEGKK